jgi:excisionase family DNA binding protein
MQDKPFYSPEEVAQYYDVTADTIRRLCREGKIPGAKQIGKQWRIPKEYLQNTSPPPEPDSEKKDQD